MGFIRSFLKFFCCHSEDENHPSEQQEPQLLPTIRDVPPKNDDPLSRELLVSSPGSEPCGEKLRVVSQCSDSIATDDPLHYQNDLEFQESSLDYHNDPSASDLLQPEVSISSARFLSCKDSNSIQSDASVINSDINLSLPEELHFQDPKEKNEDSWKIHILKSKLKKLKREKEIVEGVVEEEKWINHYSSSQKILLVGEGDFSFSASLAMAFGSASNMTATSLNSRVFLKKNYGRAISNIEDLKRKGCKVIHGVDATKMAKNPSLKDMKFDRVIFNFPHAGFFNKESRESQISRNQTLVIQFLENAKAMINEDGEIHVTHKTNYGFHREWNIVDLGTSQGLKLKQAVHFNCKDFPGYRTKYGFGGDKDFDCNPSKTYKFGFPSKRSKRKKKTSDSKTI